MKRFLITLTVIASIVASCSKNEAESVNPDVNEGSYTIKALMADSSRTSIDDGTMSWVTGDKIDIYDGDFEVFTLRGEASGAEASFTGELYYPKAVKLALCPSGIGSEVADEMLTVNMPVSYEYDGKSTHAPMIATGFTVNDNEATIKFKHLGGLFKVTYNNVPDEAKYFCFESETNQISGEFYIEDYTITNPDPAIEVGSDPEDGNIISYELPVEHLSSMSFYVPVPVGTFDFNISLRDSKKIKIANSSKTKRGFTISRGDYVNIPAVNMPQKFVENFNSTNTTLSDQVGSAGQFTTKGNTEGFNYEWENEGSVYVFKGGIRFGSGSATGSVKNSSILSDVTYDTFTVKVYAAMWNTDGGKIVVTYNGISENKDPSNTAISSPTTTDYSQNLFENATEFVFRKVDDVNELKIGSSSKRIIVDKIEIVEGGVVPANFGVSTDTINVSWDDDNASFEVIADSNVSWTISADDGITLNPTSGKGNATIGITFAQNEEETQLTKSISVRTDYASVVGESEYTITFKQSGKPAREFDGDGSKENPYSVDDALYLINNLDDNAISEDHFYVAGDICEIKSYYSGGKSINYYIGNEENKVYVYGGKDLGNGDFTSENDLNVDDKLIVYGKFQKYVDRSSVVTPEIVNSYIYSYNGATSILTGITLASDKKISYLQNDSFEKPVVTAHYKGKDDAVVTDNTEFSGYNMSEVGIQTVTASYTEGNITKTATYDITIADNTDYTITTNYDSTKGNVIVKVDDASATTAKLGQSVVVTVLPKTGNIVKSFKVNGEDKTLKAGSYSFDMPGENVSINVEFGEKPQETKSSQTSFSAISGNLNNDANISYSAEKGDGTTTPAISSNKIRLYKPSSGKSTGGILTLTANNNAKITSVVVKSNRNGAFEVKADDNVSSATISGSSPYVYTVSELDATVVTFTNKYNDSNDISSIEVTYYGGIAPTTYTLTIADVNNGEIGATVDGKKVNSGDKILQNKEVTITAISSKGYVFDSWNVTGATVGNNSTETFKMSSDVTIDATFKEQSGPTPGTDPKTYEYTFNSKSWGATVSIDGGLASAANWTGTADGNQFNTSGSPLGVQITTGAGSGATVTSPKSFANVTKVEVVYASSSKGVGSIAISVGGTAIGTQNISKSQTETKFTFTPDSSKSGNVVLTPTVTTNSMGIRKVIVYAD